MLLNTQIEDVLQSPLPHPAKGNNAADAGIHRDEALQGEEAESLGNLPLLQLFLKLQALLRPIVSQSLPDRFRNGWAKGIHQETLTMTSLPRESKKRAARSDDSEFPPETSKVLTTGLQPQTNFDKARAVPTPL